MAGSQTITATDTSNSRITGTAVVMVNPSSATLFRLVAPTTILQGSPLNLSMTALDAFGNVATGYQGLVHFSSSDTRALLPPDSSLANGQASFSVTLRTAGVQTVTANDASHPSIRGSVAVSVAALALNAAAKSVSPTEGVSFAGTVATFDDPVATDAAGSYNASINWGDGSPVSTGAVTQNSSSYSVAGAHTYAEEGTYWLTVTIVDSDGSSALLTGRAIVSDAALATTPVAFSPTEGALFNGVVARFTDVDPAGSASDYVATIDWGDGQPPLKGTIAASGTGFTVVGGHRYAEEGQVVVTVVITDSGGSFAPAISSVTVADAAIILSNVKFAAAGRHVILTGNLADRDPAGTVSDYTGSVNWGDGSTSPLSIRVVTGGFAVSAGPHTYSAKGTYRVTISARDIGGASTSYSQAVAVT